MRFERKILALADDDLIARGDSYHFGIYAGDGLARFVREARAVDRLPRRLWGFDTFSGFPETPEDQLGKYAAGGFDAREKLNIGTVAEVVRTIEDFLDPRVQLLRGSFADVLTTSLASTLGMRPACVVDVDCDLYKGALDALMWLKRCDLLVSGTIIYYDDWSAFPEHEGGESQAHDEVVAHLCDEVFRTGKGRHVKAAFRVR